MHRWTLPGLALLLTLVASPTPAGEAKDLKLMRDSSDKTATQDFELEVTRLRTEDGRHVANVKIRNVSDRTLAEVVVRCQAFGANRENLAFHEERIEESRTGPIEPGFETELRVPFDTQGRDVESVTCNAHGE